MLLCFWRHTTSNRLTTTVFQMGIASVCVRVCVVCVLCVVCVIPNSGVWCCSCSFLVSLWIHLPAWSYPFFFLPISLLKNLLRVLPRRHCSWRLYKKCVCVCGVCLCVYRELETRKRKIVRFDLLLLRPQVFFWNLMGIYTAGDWKRIWTLLGYSKQNDGPREKEKIYLGVFVLFSGKFRITLSKVDVIGSQGKTTNICGHFSFFLYRKRAECRGE